MDAVDVVRAYWEAANDRRWDDFAALLAEDVVYEIPQTRERVLGRDAYVRFNVEGFPGPWRLEIVEIAGGGRRAASWIDFTNSDGTNQPGICFFELDEAGLVARITDFWPEPYEPPAQRADLVKRY